MRQKQVKEDGEDDEDEKEVSLEEGENERTNESTVVRDLATVIVSEINFEAEYQVNVSIPGKLLAILVRSANSDNFSTTTIDELLNNGIEDWEFTEAEVLEYGENMLSYVPASVVTPPRRLPPRKRVKTFQQNSILEVGADLLKAFPTQ